MQICQFFPANTYKDTETTEDLSLDPPKFSSPFASMVAIRQILPLQNFPVYGSFIDTCGLKGHCIVYEAM